MIYLNDCKINLTKFPDKTSQVWHIVEKAFEGTVCGYIEWKFESEDEFIHLAQLKHLLDSKGYVSFLKMDYLPYARQDKEISNYTTFALHTFAKLLNSLNFHSVIVFDPHSDVAEEQIKNLQIVWPIDEIRYALKTTESDLLCFPDRGAVSRYHHRLGLPFIFGEKHRDPQTGIITQYELNGETKDKRILIVDDICDYGNTFIKLTSALRQAGAKEVNLYVSHGLFSGGIQILKDVGINRIFTKHGEYGQN